MSNYETPAPIVSVSVGTTGMKRAMKYFDKMAHLGVADRIQSVVAYDFNKTQIDRFLDWRRDRSGESNKKTTIKSIPISHKIAPKYLPFSEGFLRQTNSFIEHYGPIERDLERMVNEMEQRATEVGIRPQVIIEWVGFGGHARISYLFHEMIKERFTSAVVLPVYCLPDDRVLEQNIREHDLWDEAMQIIGHTPAVITDNRVSSNYPRLDEQVATILAGVEAGFAYRSEYGTLAENVSEFRLNGNQWLGLQIANISLKQNVEPLLPPGSGRGRKGPPLPALIEEYQRDHASFITNQAQRIKESLWRIAAPENDEQRMGFLGKGDYSDEQRIYCILPFPRETVEKIQDDVTDQLQRETFGGPFPGTKICFAKGNAQDSSCPDGHEFIQICKIYGRADEETPPSIARVLDTTNNFRGSRRRVLSRGEELMQQLGIPLTVLAADKSSGKQMTKNGSIPAPVGGW